MSNILEQIIDQTKIDLKKRKSKISFNDLHSLEGYEKPRTSFKKALQAPGISVIAEVKKSSPSKGVIRMDFKPVETALEYEKGGAAAISVLTDKPFFNGDLEYLSAISKEVHIPLLRKDFIIDPYQVKEARAFGADAFLIIVTAVSDAQLDELLAAAREFELDVLVECYNQSDFERVPFDPGGYSRSE